MSRHLLQDLIDLGIWSPELKNKIIACNGSIQAIDEIPMHIKQLYKTVWEVSQKTIIDMAAERGVYIDQSQSLNIHMSNVNSAKLTSMHFHAWKKGLKTGMYYLRTKPSTDAIKFTVDPDLIKQQLEEAENFKNLQREVKEKQGGVASLVVAAPLSTNPHQHPSSAASVRISAPAAFEAATSGLKKLAASSPVKQAPNPRGMEQIPSPGAYKLATHSSAEKTADEIRAERAAKQEEILRWQESQELGSCKGGMCSS